MTTEDLCWRAEVACMAAWPAPREVLLDGWLLRAAGGAVRRPNSVNPIRHGARDPGPFLATAEAIYGALGQAPLFRVLSLTEEIDPVLARNGYEAEGATLTLYGDIDGFNVSGAGAAELTVAPGGDWLQARAAFGAVDAVESHRFETMLASLLLPRAFAATRAEGAIAALAYGVVCGGLGVIEAVVTDPAQRGRGLGRRTVGRLLQWAKDEGAAGVCLQVVADNAPARALYSALGFNAELHGYHYRRKR